MKRIISILTLIFSTLSCSTHQQSQLLDEIDKHEDIDLVIDWQGDSDATPIPFCISSSDGKFLSQTFTGCYLEQGKIVKKEHVWHRKENIKQNIPKRKFKEVIKEVYSANFTFTSEKLKEERRGFFVALLFQEKKYISALEGDDVNLLARKLQRVFPEFKDDIRISYYDESYIKEKDKFKYKDQFKELEKHLDVKPKN